MSQQVPSKEFTALEASMNKSWEFGDAVAWLDQLTTRPFVTRFFFHTRLILLFVVRVNWMNRQLRWWWIFFFFCFLSLNMERGSVKCWRCMTDSGGLLILVQCLGTNIRDTVECRCDIPVRQFEVSLISNFRARVYIFAHIWLYFAVHYTIKWTKMFEMNTKAIVEMSNVCL